MTRLNRFLVRIADAFNFRSIGIYLIYGVIVGIVAGLGAVVFYDLCQVGLRFVLDGIAGYRPAHPFGEPPLFGVTTVPFTRYLLLVIPAIGGVFAGFIVYRFAPEAEGHGTDSAIDAYHNQKGRVRARVPIIKTIASALTLGSGGSGGREGPIAQIGAGFGSLLAEHLGLDVKARRIMLAAGLGAGIGSIFRAPLAGALFAAEILYREPEFEQEVLIPAIVTTIVAYSTFAMFLGFEPLFGRSSFSFTNPVELLPYTVLALVVSAAAPIYVKMFYGVRDLFHAMPISNYVKPAIGGLLTGIVGFFVPQTLAFGYGVVQGALNNDLGVKLLLLVALGKIATTAFSIGSGGSGGVFGPSMVIGGSLGGAVGKLLHGWWPTVVRNPGAYVIVGMAGFFAAASNAPISTVIMVSEMTGNYNLLVPAMWVCAIATLAGRRWNIYEKQVNTRADSPAHCGDFVKDHLEDVPVRDILSDDVHCEYVPCNMPLRDFIPVMTATNQQNFPLVDGQGLLCGMLSINDVRNILVDRGLDNLIILQEIADDNPATVIPDENLASALRKFTEAEVDKLPVVESSGSRRIIGMIRRRDVIGSYYRKLKEMREA